MVELALLRLAQRGERPAGLKQRRAQTLGQFPKRLADAYRPRLGHALKIERGHEMGMHGVGPQRCQVKLTDLLSHLTRNKLDRGLHFRNHPFGFVDPLQAGLTETFVLRHAANRVHLCVDICRNELAVAPHAAL